MTETTSAGIHLLDAIVLVVYFSVIVTVGMWVARFTKTTQDFFFGGQRFAWWLVAISCVATLVGSYSFIQYSQVGFGYGLSSMGPYTNDWFVLPLFLTVWLPIIYYNRITSIPEYFERRFDKRTRFVVLVMLMVYLIGYIGINLLTIGVAMDGIFNWAAVFQSVGVTLPTDVWDMGGYLNWGVILPAGLVAILSGLYLHAGGQTSVIITDVIQGFLLLAVGFIVFFLGIHTLGGFDAFWNGLPEAHQLPFAKFNSPAEFHFVGDFWNDAMVGTFAFYFINQGVLMRFLSVKSVHDGRKAMIFTVIILMPIAAIAVSNAGWIGRAAVDQGLLPAVSSKHIFIAVSRAVCQPGVFGLVIAAMIAALMSTLDTLITAVSAVVVNDIVRPLVPNQTDAYYLKIAKRVALFCTVFGIVLIPVFDQFGSIYKALSHFTSMLIPPLVVVIGLGTIFKSFSARAAFYTLVCGALAILVSLIFPSVITPFAHGAPAEGGYSYMRSFYGLITSSSFAAIFWWIDRKHTPKADLSGLVLSRIEEGIAKFKGGAPRFTAALKSGPLKIETQKGTETARLPQRVMDDLDIEPGDLIYVVDTRWWLGGFRSMHIKAGEIADDSFSIYLPEEKLAMSSLLPTHPVRVERHL